ncbi:hypothetical protein, partial [Marinimicrobium sp. ABcell2]|uniref:hypothetical protein n=1 Tax=Marinimicrobium sp. ABcell2 TaxID=3069751 RepID=UPI0027B6BE20
MKIIFNSDLLYADSFIKDRLPRHLHNFLVECKEHGHEIIIPETTLLEFDRKQSVFLQKEMSEIESAKEKLSLYGVEVELDIVKLVSK